jgi:quinohemoprotein ethanol dehydrogenase
LRESALALDRASFTKVVRDGAALPKGMPRFARLSDAELGQLYSYVREMARAEIRRKRGS